MPQAQTIARAATLACSLACALGATGTRAHAQTPDSAIELWVGLARNSPELGILGKTPNMSLAMAGLRFTRPPTMHERGSRSFTTEWHTDLIPLAIISPPLVSRTPSETLRCPPRTTCAFPPEDEGLLFGAGAATGIGVNPLGLTVRLRPERTLSPSLGITGGALVFDRRVPTTRGAHFNFTTTLEAGLRVGAVDGTALVLAYRFHHISNAGLAPQNLAVASHLVTVAMRNGRPRD